MRYCNNSERRRSKKECRWSNGQTKQGKKLVFSIYIFVSSVMMRCRIPSIFEDLQVRIISFSASYSLLVQHGYPPKKVSACMGRFPDAVTQRLIAFGKALARILPLLRVLKGPEKQQCFQIRVHRHRHSRRYVASRQAQISSPRSLLHNLDLVLFLQRVTS